MFGGVVHALPVPSFSVANGWGNGLKLEWSFFYKEIIVKCATIDKLDSACNKEKPFE